MKTFIYNNGGKLILLGGIIVTIVLIACGADMS